MHIIRYSVNGFKPQYQSHHLVEIDYEQNGFIKDFNKIPEHLKIECLKRHNRLVPFYKQHNDLFQYGVWAFINGYKNNQALNHLKYKVPCWEADIDDNAIVVGVNWDHLMFVKDGECTIFGFYIPEQSMQSIRNIKRRCL
ncbi:MAG: hypothetical protein PHC62_08675 [Candidatus Izemoplasmatales bacterium]|nr:hypothetical protein [Candidatus Izemoplasmatales bacterium]